MEFWGVAVGAAVASVAWTYQRAWEHQEKRIELYRKIVDRLPAFTTNGLNQDKLNEALAEGRKLWLSAPDDVVLAYENLLDFAEGKNAASEQQVLGQCIKAMRRDATFSAALFPRFWRTRLRSKSFRLRSAQEDKAPT